MDRRVSFIRSLEVEYPPVARRRLACNVAEYDSAEAASSPPDDFKAYVCDGSLLSFTANVTGQQKKDVLNSALLAQLVANKKYDRENDTQNWYKLYTEVMENVGWVIQGFQFIKHDSSQKDFKLSQVTLELLSALVGGEAGMMQTVKASLDGLARSADGVSLFGSSSTSDKAGNFQVVPCTVDKSKQVTVGLVGFYFQASQSAKDFFFFTWKSQDIQLYKSSQMCTLNEDVYAQVRDEVIKKLGDNAHTKLVGYET